MLEMTARGGEKDTCLKCKRSEDDEYGWIACYKCAGWTHAGCSSVSATICQAIDSNPHFLFVCTRCIKKPPPPVAPVDLTELKDEIKQYIHETLQTTCPIKRQPITERPNNEQQKPKFRPANPDGLRIRGIPEPDRGRFATREAQLKCDMESIRDVMIHMDIDCEILDLRRLGNYDEQKIEAY